MDQLINLLNICLALRAIPNLNVFRPADINETLECWEASLNNDKGPSAIILIKTKIKLRK